MVNYVTRYLENKLKPELGHKTVSKANFEKICRPELRLEERITCAKFQKIWPYKNTKVGVGFAGTGVPNLEYLTRNRRFFLEL